MIAHGRHPQVDEASPMNFLQGCVLEALPASAMERDLEIRESARVCAWELKRRGRGSCGCNMMQSRVGIRPEDGPTDCPRGVLLLSDLSFLASTLWHRWKPLWCATQGVMTSEDFCRTRHDRVRPGTTVIKSVRLCHAMSGWLWLSFNSTTWKMWRDKDGRPDRGRTRTRIEW